MKKLLLNLMALMPCGMLISSNNNNMPQLSGTKPAAASPMQPHTDMNDKTGMVCPTEEEFATMFQQIQDEINNMTPEERAKFEQEITDGFALAYEQMTPEQRAEFDQTMNLFSLEQAGEEIIEKVAQEAYNQGSMDKEIAIAREVETLTQEIAPLVQEAAKELEEMAKSCPVKPAISVAPEKSTVPALK